MRVVDAPLCPEDCEQCRDGRPQCILHLQIQLAWLGLEAGEVRSPAGVICHPFPHYFPTQLNCVRRFGATP